MLAVLQMLYRRYLSNAEAIILLLILLAVYMTIVLAGELLAPVFASIVFAYLLESGVTRLTQRDMKRSHAVALVYCSFLAVMPLILLGLVPILWQQALHLSRALPELFANSQVLLQKLLANYPGFTPNEPITAVLDALKGDLAKMGQHILSISIASLTGLMTTAIYLVLVPLLVFFWLKDRPLITGWMSQLLPRRRTLLTAVGEEVHHKIGNYVRGKVLEMVVVTVVTYVSFLLLHLQYPLLLAVLVGVSVFIPYVGAVVVTVPVVLIAFLQWGLTPPFAYLMLVYTLIHTLDGMILVPLLFSEAVDLHPIAIIVAILFFGGIWGFWGVFFAIPLAVLVRAIGSAWPVAMETAP